MAKSPIYIPFSDVCRTLFINIPDSMREATYRALTKLEREVGDVDAYVAAKLNYCHTRCSADELSEGLKTLCSAFANEQVDALALAIYNYEEKNRTGLIIADQTGIGKGRSIAGMLRYAHLNGMTPIFITKSPSLFSDIYRDLYDIGMDDFTVYKYKMEVDEEYTADEIVEEDETPEAVEGLEDEDEGEKDTFMELRERFRLNPDYEKEIKNKRAFVPFIINGRSRKTHVRDFDGNILYEGLPSTSSEFRSVINGSELPDDYNVILCTYSQFGRVTKKMDFLRTIAPKSFIVLDESHTASGESRVGKYLRELTELAKGTVFSSATYAKRPDNFLLYIGKTPLRDANMRPDLMVTAIQKGGVALQEVIASQLTEEGYLIRRERTYDENVTVSYIYLDESQEQHIDGQDFHPEWNKKEEHWEKYNNIIHYLFKIIKFQEEYVIPMVEMEKERILQKYGDESGAIGAKEMKKTKNLGAFINPLFSQLFNFTYQLFFSLKADIVSAIAIKHLKEGRKPIIAFKSTLESMLNYLVNDKGDPVKTGDLIRDDYAVVLEKLLFGALRYREEYPDKTVIKFIKPEDVGGDFEIVFKSVHKDIKKMTFGIPSSPIDYILNKIRNAGFTKIEEITARTRKLIPSEKDGYVRITNRKPINVNEVARRFQNNEIDCLLLNQSGATGISLHATRVQTGIKTDAEVRQRAMLIMQAELDINVEVQKRGRIYRTGQIKNPMYEYINTSIPAERRLMMMLQKKLKSLDANTSSNQQQSKALLTYEDFLNKYGDIVVKEWLKKNPQVNIVTGDLIGTEKGEDIMPPDLAYRVSGRIALLDCQTQERYFDEVYKAYLELIDELKRKDEYDLEVEAVDIEAEFQDKDVWIRGFGTGGYFAGDTYLSKYLVNNLRKPMKYEEISSQITSMTENKTAEETKNEMIEEYKRYNSHRQEEDEKYFKEKYERERKEIMAIKELSAEKKQDKIEKIKENEDEQMERIKKRYELNTQLNRFFDFFTIGKTIAYPANDYETTRNWNYGIVINIQPKRTEKNPFAPSNIILTLAINTGERQALIPLSRAEGLEHIITVTEDNEYDMDEIANWNEISKDMQKDRIIRYIVTGNLLQAYDKHSKMGRLVRFTVKDGGEEVGILTPLSFDPYSRRDGDIEDRVKVPARFALPFIKGLSSGMIIGTDSGLQIGRRDLGIGLSIPSRKDYKAIYTDSALTRLLSDGEFRQTGKTMMGTMANSHIPALITFMDEKRMNIMVHRTYYDTIQEQEGDTGEEKKTRKQEDKIVVDYSKKQFYEKLFTWVKMIEKDKGIMEKGGEIEPLSVAQKINNSCI